MADHVREGGGDPVAEPVTNYEQEAAEARERLTQRDIATLTRLFEGVVVIVADADAAAIADPGVTEAALAASQAIVTRLRAAHP